MTIFFGISVFHGLNIILHSPLANLHHRHSSGFAKILPVIIFYFEHIHFRNGKYSSENLWTTTFSVRLDRRNRGPVCGDGGHVGHCCRRILRRQHLELPGDHLHPQYRHHDHNRYHRDLKRNIIIIILIRCLVFLLASLSRQSTLPLASWSQPTTCASED